ncbi:MAG: diacylglycerol kinase family enzyme [Candidatus Aldehydirespiratoraceae bacterium]
MSAGGVKRGQDWGDDAPVPDDALSFDNDRAAAEALGAARRRNADLPPVVLTGGDVARTLGGGRGVPPHAHVEIDLGAVLVDGKLHWFLAHLVARQSWLRGRVVVAANAAFIGEWNIAPRAHPGDGKLDVLDGNPGLGDRVKARRRLASGTHLPHPDITVRRSEAVQIDLSEPTRIFLDGTAVGRAQSLSIRTEPGVVDVWI